MSQSELNKILASPRLPTLPAVAARVLELTLKPQVDMPALADVIRNDQALAGKVLRTVNSSYFGLKQPCTTIHQAIVLLGLNAVKTLVLGFSLVESINQSASGEDLAFDYIDYWRRGLYSALGAREIARLTRTCDAESAFLAALMQDIGMVSMDRALGDRYLQCVDLTRGDHRRLIPIERQAFANLDHAEVGAVLASRWKLPVVFVDAIRHHHQPDAAPPASLAVARTVELAGFAAAALTELQRAADDAMSAGVNAPPIVASAGPAMGQFTQAFQRVHGRSNADARRLLSSLSIAAKEMASLLSLDVGSLPNVAHLLEEAEAQIIAHQATLASQAQAADDPALTASDSARAA